MEFLFLYKTCRHAKEIAHVSINIASIKLLRKIKMSINKKIGKDIVKDVVFKWERIYQILCSILHVQEVNKKCIYVSKITVNQKKSKVQNSNKN